MDNRKLQQSELEMLSAFMDGQVGDAQARELQRRIADDGAWAQAAQELRELNALLDTWQAPAVRPGLAGQIAHNARRQPRRRLAIPLWISGLSAAAALVIAFTVLVSSKPADHASQPPVVQAGPTETPKVHDALAGIDTPDQFIVENLGFFREMEYAQAMAEAEIDPQTLDALDTLDRQGRGS